MNSTVTPPSCPICQSPNTKFLFESWDFMHGYPGKFPLWKCKSCGHIHLAGEFTPEMLTDMYSNYYARSEFHRDNYKPYKDRTGFFAWLDGDRSGCHCWVPPNVRVLDVGCGWCEALGYHKARGCECWGCEADENVQKIADQHGFNVRIGLFNPDDYEKNYFDYVTMNQVIEHVLDPLETLRQVRTVLKPGGKLIFGTPYAYSIERFTFGRYWMGWHTPYHLNLFSQKSANIMLEQTGFRLVESQCRMLSVNLLNTWAILFVHGKPGVPMRFRGSVWSNIDSFGSELERLWYVRLYRILEKIRIHAWLTRFADALGVGMNRIYVAVKA